MNFFLEKFGGMENSLYFCTRFWEIQYLKRIKKEFFERFYINRQVVQEAVFDYTLLYYRAVDWDWVKETSRQEIDIQVFLDYNKFS